MFRQVGGDDPVERSEWMPNSEGREAITAVAVSSYAGFPRGPQVVVTPQGHRYTILSILKPFGSEVTAILIPFPYGTSEIFLSGL